MLVHFFYKLTNGQNLKKHFSFFLGGGAGAGGGRGVVGCGGGGGG